ncbi:hypothetical protein Cni_G14332 [Canna indica]|uniref:RING-type domain-containing protein n=1 Tax=Canna indica TaxID=4628 RepID=A0AAQ3KEM6_9LILI|nr:hypothetical protein Cni_G14332 [Canna indica]
MADASSPPPLSLTPLPLAVVPDRLPPSASLSFSPSLHIIAAILACVLIACASIHLLLRLLSSSSSPTASVVTASLLVRSRPTPAGVNVTSAAAAASSDKVKSALIDSLPIFNLSSSLAALPKSSPDCAVCLRPFRPDENLRLLPACRHAFHSGCVEPWIRNTPSCPLCRTRVTLPPPSLTSPAMPRSLGSDPSRLGGNFCVEISGTNQADDGASRRNPSLPAPVASPPIRRTSSIGSSFDYTMDEEAVERIRRRADEVAASSAATPQAEEGGGTRGGGGGSRRWLKDYMDRVTSSASSSFRRSGRWSQRYDSGGERDSVDLELEGRARRESTDAEDDNGLAALYSGNLLSSGDGCGDKVVLHRGTIRELDGPMSVADLMLEHPHQFVVDVHTVSVGSTKVVLPLPTDHMLEYDGAYAMLPMASAYTPRSRHRRYA